MNVRRIELALRKQQLLLASATQRAQLASHADGLKTVCSGVDRVVDAGRWLGRHPAAVALAGTALVVLRPRLMWRLGWRGLTAWRLARKLWGLG